jgi:hypothetical protein
MPMTLSKEVAKNPEPSTPAGASTIFTVLIIKMLVLIVVK